MKILIPNVTGPTNFGDQAILFGLLSLSSTVYPNAKVVIHSTDPELYSGNKYLVNQSLFQLLIIRNKNLASRIYRLFELLTTLVLIKYLGKGFKKQLDFLNRKNLSYKLLNDYLDSDLIIFVGGGYLRSKAGITQSLNLIMQLIMFITAIMLNKNRIVAPISFGPFAYKWQEKLASYILSKFLIVSLRESVSFSILKQYGLKNIVLSHDHAFLINRLKTGKKNKKMSVGFTIRPWLDEKSQWKLEEAYAEALCNLYSNFRTEIVPIMHVDSPDFPKESDSHSVKRVYELLKVRGVKVKKPFKVERVRNAANLYRNLDLLIGMRMHSNILAATQNTPFVAISYEHKTDGIMKQLGLEKFCVKCTDLESDKLKRLSTLVFDNKKIIKKHLRKTIDGFQKDEHKLWLGILSSFEGRTVYKNNN